MNKAMEDLEDEEKRAVKAVYDEFSGKDAQGLRVVEITVMLAYKD